MMHEPVQRAGDAPPSLDDQGEALLRPPAFDGCRHLEHDQWRRRLMLERQLHDGAALRISALTLRLGLISNHVAKSEPDVVEYVDGLQDELHAVLQELRDITSKIYPPLLDQAGLGPALREVLYRVAARIDVPEERFGAAAEGAAYFAITTCFEAVGGDASPVDLVVRREAGMLVIGLAGIDVRHAPLMLDTVWRMGGTIDVAGGPGVGTIIARIPCE